MIKRILILWNRRKTPLLSSQRKLGSSETNSLQLLVLIKNHLATITLYFFTTSISFAHSNVINVYNWSGYMPQKALAQFEEETGIHVNYSTFNSNETLYAKLKIDPNTNYDIVVPSSYYVQRMIREKMLRKINKSKLSNFKHLNPALLNKAYDPNNHYSIPYLWGSTGIILNKKYYSTHHIRQWKDLWKPQYTNQLALTDDIRDMFGITLKMLGYSINDRNPTHIHQAYLALKQLMKNAKTFESDGSQQMYINEDVNLGILESGDANIVIKHNDSFKYIYPKDGPILWIDNMVIPRGAKHIKNAYRFMNFLMRPDIAKMISISVGYSSPNIAAIKLMSKSLQHNHTLNPTLKNLKNAEVENDIGHKTMKLYLHYWELLKLES